MRSRNAGRAPTAPTAPKPVILYVEDEEANAEVAEARLSRDYQLVIAENDQRACAILASDQEFYAILMDIQLQGSRLTGLDLARLVRGRPLEAPLPPYAQLVRPRTKVPMFFVTAYGSRYSSEELASIGVTGTVAKPVDFVRLSMALARAAVSSIAALDPRS